MKRSKRVQFKVSFPLPAGASERDARLYVLDAVASMKGSLQPPRPEEGQHGDPMFLLDGDSVRVAVFRK